jgi:hydroxymethylglutaryl-CoA lyase
MLEKLPEKVRIIEVGPRDGLQNETTILTNELKISFIEKLAAAGLTEIEATSFVRADRIPQMGDAVQLFGSLTKIVSPEKKHLICLVPNSKGLENAISAGVKDIAVFTATSDEFNKKNINASIDESLVRIEDICKEAVNKGIRVRGYISTVFGCPYQGETSLKKMIEISERLLDLGAYEVSLGDTIGVANPLQVKAVAAELSRVFSLDRFSLHMHDTRGTALANVLAGLESGFTSFDSSAGGLGGCPYAAGATGNLATEDLVYMLHSMGIETGIDLEKLSEASNSILGELKRKSSSKYLLAWQSKRK